MAAASGQPCYGDMVKLWITGPAADRITDCKWQTFGCACSHCLHLHDRRGFENGGMTTTMKPPATLNMIMEQPADFPNGKSTAGVFG